MLLKTPLKVEDFEWYSGGGVSYWERPYFGEVCKVMVFPEWLDLNES